MPEFSVEVNTIIETDDFINSLESVDKISNLYFHQQQQQPLESGLLWVCKELQVSINLNCQCMASMSPRSHRAG